MEAQLPMCGWGYRSGQGMPRTPNTSNGETVPTLGLRCHLCPRRNCQGPWKSAPTCLLPSQALLGAGRSATEEPGRGAERGEPPGTEQARQGAEPMESDQALDSILSKVCESFFASLTSIYLLSFCDVWYLGR